MKILFIACYSPLINNSASIETLQYLNNLSKIEGNEIHLLTVNFPKNSIYYDEDIFNMLDKKIKLHVISGGKIFESIMPRKSSNNIEDQSGKSTLKVKFKSKLKTLKKIIAVPDMYLRWAFKASEYGIGLMEKENFDVMFSMHEPPSSHICAYRIKKKFKDLKWVTYWSDPWLKDSTREGIGSFRKTFEGKYEKNIVNLSDKYIFVTEQNRDDYINTYNIKKSDTFIITRGYDDKFYSDLKNGKEPEFIDKNKINIVYAGEIFSKLRDVKPFIKSIEKINKDDEKLNKKINILFFGNIDDESIKNDLIHLDNTKVSGRISYKEATRYMVNADILLLFGNKNSKQIPAKIYDYFGCVGYILVVLGDDNDPIINLVKDLDKCFLSSNNSDEIYDSLIKISENILNGRISKPIDDYRWDKISKKLHLILKGD